MSSRLLLCVTFLLAVWPGRAQESRGAQNFWSLSLLKAFTLREGLKLQLRADAQNALNHAHFAAPNTSPVSPLFGTVNSTASEPRVMFVGLRLAW